MNYRIAIEAIQAARKILALGLEEAKNDPGFRERFPYLGNQAILKHLDSMIEYLETVRR